MKKVDPNQTTLFDAPKAASPVDRIVAKARLRKIVRGQWGIHARGGKWKYDGDGCCALGAFLEDVEVGRHESSPRVTAARLLGVEGRDIDAFIRGFDNRATGGNERWERVGHDVAVQLGLA